MNPGTLYLVATPIGNLGDMPPRAVKTLSEVSLIYAEDTRVFQVLARQFAIRTPVRSLHDHNERRVTPAILEKLTNGESLALVSDAGTPLVSDPGYLLVQACHDAAIPVRAVPGPAAFLTALILSGFETDTFVFEGFLPLRPGKLKRRIAEILAAERTTVLYESPHRIEKLLTRIAELAPEREIFVARELTKLYEEHLRGAARAVLEILSARSVHKGEFVVVIRRGDAE